MTRRLYASGYRFVYEIGGMMRMTASATAAAVRPPFTWGPEFVSQFIFALRLGWLPMIVASVGISYGPAGIQAAKFLTLFGAVDRLGALFALIVLREFAPLICALVIAGVAGTAMCADLGARKIREELDALNVLGVDPVRNLVVPRFLALVLITSLFNIYAVLFGTFGGMLVAVSNHLSLGSFFATYLSNATTAELAGSVAKTAIFGGIIAIVCCYKGLNVSGGPEGVGRAVNQAVVIAFLGIGAVDYVFTQTLLATDPNLTMVR